MGNRVSRRGFLGMIAAGAALQSVNVRADSGRKPNVLFVMTDQQRADAIAALGNSHIYTPNMDRLAARGVAFVNAYSTCPVCVPARLTIRTGCEPPTTGCYANMRPDVVERQAAGNEARCGTYLARTMARLGYRTFGIGKFHTSPWDEDIGYEVHLHSGELYGSPEHRARDDYAAFIAREHPEYDFVEGLMGERTEMYYAPQMSPLPAHLGVEAWAADRAVEQINRGDERPYFGFVSFIGPHPPCAPPIPFNRMYDPDRMPDPVRGHKDVDGMDEYVRWMNYAIWAEDITDSHARVVKARYYGEISYIDECLGRILDAVEARGDGDNTLIAFFADHGDHLGDHGAWQKESFFDAACRVPFLVSWPARLPAGARRDELVCLTDLFGIATTAAGKPELREGADVLGMLAGQAPARERLIGYYGVPGTNRFKVMVREGEWKYIYMANGGLEQLFNLKDDARELRQRIADAPEVAGRLRVAAVEAVRRPNANRALDADGTLEKFPREEIKRQRIYQFDGSRGVRGFPERPQDVVRSAKP
ncbi:MAG TPA: sulfatase-like hydrolase/transferase [Candidatus Bathyarchaeia archaeon]|nr:sulfatase-like hydrolase/transferase [Candidatus Bathyarchaeia archaeon]